ncbi:signal transduction histidine kinase [Prescottella agglutinans]|uniref:histidine kinase n=1 Tax=Prescottella agglutinans TaxID=1644129 RepID=A0ABT6M744_9NOCA|nr:signal transduction histidine kinase [Prescottella agglutinans]
MLKVRLGIRARILAIALVPSLALLGIGVGTAGYLIREGRQSEQWAAVNQEAVSHARDVVALVEEERMLSLWQLSGARSDPAALDATRKKLDAAFAELARYSSELQTRSKGAMGADTGGFDTLSATLPQIRGQIDAGRMPIEDTYAIYNRILDAVALGSNQITSNAPNAQVGVALLNGVRTLHAMEGMSRSAALTAAELSGRLSGGPLRNDYRNLVGSYRITLPQLAADLGADPAAEKIRAALESPGWQQVAAMEDYLINPPEPDKYGDVPPPPMTFAEWHSAQEQLSEPVIDAWKGLNDHANQIAADEGKRTAANSLWAGAAVLALALVAFLLSLWLANRLIGRLKRLRKETLDLAEVELPETMRKLAAGEQIDPQAAHLDFGDDEIGSVAQAFNRAHTAAVSAAVTEARTREGVRAVFLNIAHRSQMVVHRQLEVLDEAEQRQEDPAMLEAFFRLDHLATRERRNAENLVILGGGQPGRRWRSPVPLVDLVRSAISESLDYKRVHNRRMPQVFIVGNVVADLIHLLAELLDNATAFSPPQSRVEVSGNVVGKGVVIEISDQGMGMSAEELDRVNEMLRNPPDFGVETLSETSRLGLFIVSQLGVRHGISVQLSESEYGGIRAIVLVPNSLVAADTTPVVGDVPDRFADHGPEVRTAGALPDLDSAESASAAVGVATLAPTTPAPPIEQPVQPVAPTRAWAHLDRVDIAPQAEYTESSVTTAWHEVPTPAAEPASFTPQPLLDNGGDGRPNLPRRRRQASLAPELAHDPQPEPETEAQQPQRSAEQARDLMSAITYGTQQARQSAPPPEYAIGDEMKGDGR